MPILMTLKTGWLIFDSLTRGLPNTNEFMYVIRFRNFSLSWILLEWVTQKIIFLTPLTQRNHFYRLSMIHITILKVWISSRNLAISQILIVFIKKLKSQESFSDIFSELSLIEVGLLRNRFIDWFLTTINCLPVHYIFPLHIETLKSEHSFVNMHPENSF